MRVLSVQRMPESQKQKLIICKKYSGLERSPAGDFQDRFFFAVSIVT